MGIGFASTRREPREGSRGARAALAAHRRGDHRRDRDPALDRRRRRHDADRGERGRRGRSAAPRPTTRTSSSAPPSTTGSRARSGSRSSPPASAAAPASAARCSKRPSAARRSTPATTWTSRPSCARHGCTTSAAWLQPAAVVRSSADGHVPRDSEQARRPRLRRHADPGRDRDAHPRRGPRSPGSSRNTQQWEFVVVETTRDAARGRGLRAGERRAARRSSSRSSATRAAFDVGRCAQNMMLAAWNDGVGSCPNGISDPEAAERSAAARSKTILSLRLSRASRATRTRARRRLVGAARSASRSTSSFARCDPPRHRSLDGQAGRRSPICSPEPPRPLHRPQPGSDARRRRPLLPGQVGTTVLRTSALRRRPAADARWERPGVRRRHRLRRHRRTPDRELARRSGPRNSSTAGSLSRS